MKPAGAPTLFVIDDDAAVRAVPSTDRRCSREVRPRKGIVNHALK
jgi:hypothetical protein